MGNTCLAGNICSTFIHNPHKSTEQAARESRKILLSLPSERDDSNSNSINHPAINDSCRHDACAECRQHIRDCCTCRILCSNQSRQHRHSASFSNGQCNQSIHSPECRSGGKRENQKRLQSCFAPHNHLRSPHLSPAIARKEYHCSIVPWGRRYCRSLQNMRELSLFPLLLLLNTGLCHGYRRSSQRTWRDEVLHTCKHCEPLFQSHRLHASRPQIRSGCGMVCGPDWLEHLLPDDLFSI